MYNNIDACMIKDNYLDRRDMLNTIVMLMGYKRFRRCNKMLKTLSMHWSIIDTLNNLYNLPYKERPVIRGVSF